MSRDKSAMLKIGAVAVLVLFLALLAKLGALPAFMAWLTKLITAAVVPPSTN